MTLKGFDVLINEAAATRWLKRHSIWYRSLPMDYPCIVEERLDASKNGYPFYYYRETLDAYISKCVLLKQYIEESDDFEEVHTEGTKELMKMIQELETHKDLLAHPVIKLQARIHRRTLQRMQDDANYLFAAGILDRNLKVRDSQ